MKAQELRIGNWLNYQNTLVWVMSITRRYCDFGYFIDSVGFMRNFTDTDFPSPIPLTEEWLLKFGFAKCNEYHFEFGKYTWFELNDRRFILKTSLRGPGISIHYHDGEDNNVISLDYIQYIHQLQNLYFALTGEELIIK